MRSLILIAFALAACTSNPNSSVSVTGTPLGRPFVPRDAMVVLGEPGTTWVLVITDYENACTRYPGVASSTIMKVRYKGAAGAAAPTAQTYTGLDVEPWDLQSFAFDTGCIQSDDAPGTGTLSLTSVMPDAASGSFDLKFSTTDGYEHVTGEFTAPTCQLPATAGTTCR
jgi:hypothetical protein